MALIRHESERMERSEGAYAGGRTSNGDFLLTNEAPSLVRRNYPLIVRVTYKRGLPLARSFSRLAQVSLRDYRTGDTA